MIPGDPASPGSPAAGLAGFRSADGGNRGGRLGRSSLGCPTEPVGQCPADALLEPPSADVPDDSHDPTTLPGLADPTIAFGGAPDDGLAGDLGCSPAAAALERSGPRALWTFTEDALPVFATGPKGARRWGAPTLYRSGLAFHAGCSGDGVGFTPSNEGLSHPYHPEYNEFDSLALSGWVRLTTVGRLHTIFHNLQGNEGYGALGPRALFLLLCSLWSLLRGLLRFQRGVRAVGGLARSRHLSTTCGH